MLARFSLNVCLIPQAETARQIELKHRSDIVSEANLFWGNDLNINKTKFFCRKVMFRVARRKFSASSRRRGEILIGGAWSAAKVSHRDFRRKCFSPSQWFTAVWRTIMRLQYFMFNEGIKADGWETGGGNVESDSDLCQRNICQECGWQWCLHGMMTAEPGEKSSHQTPDWVAWII